MIRGLALALLVAACSPLPSTGLQTGNPPAPAPVIPAPPLLSPDPATAARNFLTVAQVMEPRVEQACLALNPSVGCDFQVLVDDRPGQPPNAFQTLGPSGQPIIAFTLSLIAEAKNQDELAFIFGHEAAHHILGHIPKTRDSAMVGAVVLGSLTSLGGGSADQVEQAYRIGATVGARRFSQGFELQADELGTELAFAAGYDPAIGAQFFDRLPDPGNSFLGTHPPNAARKDTVARTLLRLRGY